ncbi:MAG: chromosome segregation protein SMC [Pseudonocardiales bacterium]|nr:chromosome segregation protein SMC [Pseudonocardiales bacterium]MBV9731033.1 chromosome segregation protein SMC [Pseudonocardiales bacterium]
MHLKSLTLKGFKSFASATTLRFEPGITCVVGPNGSGKSNVVDALSWVMGEQGAKALRGGKMEDVIFAGTVARPPLGRAEVTLTIDNTDGALPIDYTEVSVTRRMFRDGASEYEINGSSCRLLDVQELLSDSGIGREMHVIVGQGKLDSILQSKPEERRAFIEEAAGVLKHRKRKEKALRKLEGMQANLTRLSDLTAELRRQLKPLGKQAEIARRAQAVQADLRDARLRLHADDLVSLREAFARDEADEAAARARRAEVESALDAARAEQAALEEQLDATAPHLAAAQDTWYQLSALAERLRGTVRLAVQRARHLSAPTEQHRPGRDPDELEREAAAAQVTEAELHAVVEEASVALSGALDRRVELEQVVADAERAHLAVVRAVADRREGLARLAGQVEALRSTSGATAEEIERLSRALGEASDRTQCAQREFDELRLKLDALHAGEVRLDERHEAALTAYATAAQRSAELAAAHREAEQQGTFWRARVEALSIGLTRKDGSQLLLAAGLPGVTGSVAALLTVDPGAQAAVAAALGAAADALAVSDVDVAATALSLLRAQDAGRAGLLVGGAPATVDRETWPELPAGARWAVDLLQAPEALCPALHRLLERTAVVDDLDAARALVAAAPTMRAVTVDGDVLGADWAQGGSGRSLSIMEVQAAVDDGHARLAESETCVERLAAELDGASAEEAERAEDVDNTLAALHESDAQLAAVAEQLARLGQAARSASDEAGRLHRQRDESQARQAGALRSLAELEERLRLAQDESVDTEPDTSERDEAIAALGSARSEEVEARLALRTAEERARALAGRAEGLRRSAQAERVAQERAAAAAAARQRGAAVATEVAGAGEFAVGRIEISLQRAAAERDAVVVERAQREQGLAEVRARVRQLARELDELTDTVHRDELLRAQQRLRIEQLETRVSDDFGIGLDDLIAEYGPAVPVPPMASELAEYEAAARRGEQVSAPQPASYDRISQTRRAQRAERDLTLLGKVNPLALEEFAALEERYKFLSTQLEDLKATRRDLLTVITEVDEKILEVFTEAFHDVAREFETVFATLFPGGEGRLLLTEPDDMLTTGIEVEARPPGKKIKRLSLLSGGERSLTAVAMLVAIFRARPSPFYVLDEVEAALDETNLNRLLALFELLRDRSQLIVITHQKATMEVADALYGVSMRGDGITTVISQRLRGTTDSAGAA